VEAMSRSLSRRDGNIILVQSEKSISLTPIWFTTLSPAGAGNFTCCACNHRFGDVTVPCDKLRVCDVTAKLINKKLGLLRTSDMFGYRHLRANRSTHYEGFDLPSAAINDDGESLEIWLSKYHFEAWNDVDGGWCPLRYAAMSGNASAVRSLLEMEADVNRTIERDSPDHLHSVDSSILHSVLTCCRHDVSSILRLLLDARADPFARSPIGAQACHIGTSSVPARGVMCGNVAAVHAWLDLFPSWDLTSETMLNRGLVDEALRMYSLSKEMVGLVERFLQLGAKSLRPGPTLYMVGANPFGASDPVVLDLLLRYKYDDLDVNAVISDAEIEDLNLKGFETKIGVETFIEGSTALFVAAAGGKFRLVDWLLRNRANPSVKSLGGRNALDVAAAFGFDQIALALQHSMVSQIDIPYQLPRVTTWPRRL